MPKKGKFIVIEGTEGTGKTIQSQMLRDKFEELDLPVFLTPQPSTGPIGRIIRHTYLSGERVADRRLINYLYAADRLDLITNNDDGLLYKINQGINVITDRHYMTSLAIYALEFFDTPEYMSQMQFIMDLNKASYEILPPDVSIVLTAPTEVIDKRLGGSAKHHEIYDNHETIIKTQKTYEDAINMLRARGENIIKVDGARSTWKVHGEIWDIVSKILE